MNIIRCCDARDEEDGTVKIKIIEQKTGPLYKDDLNSEVSLLNIQTILCYIQKIKIIF